MADSTYKYRSGQNPEIATHLPIARPASAVGDSPVFSTEIPSSQDYLLAQATALPSHDAYPTAYSAVADDPYSSTPTTAQAIVISGSLPHDVYLPNSNAAPLPPRTPRPDFEMMKKERLQRQFAAGVGGAIVGFVLLGPLGALVGGICANKITKASGRSEEKRRRKQYERAVEKEERARRRLSRHRTSRIRS